MVAAVQGMCAGGGMYHVNEADIVICAEDAVFFDPHANAGIVSTVEAVGMLARGVPLGDTLRWALMGKEERLDASSALRLGIVSEVTATDQLRARAREIAASIAGRDPKAIQGSVRGIWEALEARPHPGAHQRLQLHDPRQPVHDDRQPEGDRPRHEVGSLPHAVTPPGLPCAIFEDTL